jgi:hypothetical protein
MALSTTPASGTQGATQSPQTSAPTSSGTASADSGQIQPGTTNSLLQSHDGTTLHPGALTTVNLSSSTNSFSQAKAVEPRHINGALLFFSILLFVAAVVLFWATNRSVNKTTR